MCLFRWMLRALKECQSFILSLWWHLLEECSENTTGHITQDKQLLISILFFLKMWMHAPFMWGSEQETVQECLQPSKQLYLVSYTIKQLHCTKSKSRSPYWGCSGDSADSTTTTTTYATIATVATDVTGNGSENSMQQADSTTLIGEVQFYLPYRNFGCKKYFHVLLKPWK